ncbi:MAG: LssY C-terminal domain-containing protein [Terrimicrobiaceae bacterium]
MKHIVFWLILILVVWAGVAYLLAPLVWKLYFRHHFNDAPRITHTSDGHPGDPINLAIEGSEEQLVKAMIAAGWYPADPITLASSIRIAVDSVFRKPDADAPVSALFLFGRKQDLAFELPVGDSPRQRHHVRFWLWDKLKDGRPVWFGSATFDERVGLSHTTGQITHHTGPDVDAERNLIMQGLQKAGRGQDEYFVGGFQQPPEGRNGGGDPWRTDGRLGAIVLKNP